MSPPLIYSTKVVFYNTRTSPVVFRKRITPRFLGKTPILDTTSMSKYLNAFENFVPSCRANHATTSSAPLIPTSTMSPFSMYARSSHAPFSFLKWTFAWTMCFPSNRRNILSSLSKKSYVAPRPCARTTSAFSTKGLPKNPRWIPFCRDSWGDSLGITKTRRRLSFPIPTWSNNINCYGILLSILKEIICFPSLLAEGLLSNEGSRL